jgi:hypothetical protein
MLNGNCRIIYRIMDSLTANLYNVKRIVDETGISERQVRYDIKHHPLLSLLNSGSSGFGPGNGYVFNGDNEVFQFYLEVRKRSKRQTYSGRGRRPEPPAQTPILDASNFNRSIGDKCEEVARRINTVINTIDTQTCEDLLWRMLPLAEVWSQLLSKLPPEKQGEIQTGEHRKSKN